MCPKSGTGDVFDDRVRKWLMIDRIWRVEENQPFDRSAEVLQLTRDLEGEDATKRPSCMMC